MEVDDARDSHGDVLDASGRIAVDVRCRACRYLLRSLTPSDACPECGRPVRDSLVPDLLVSARPDWLRRVRGGITTLLLAFARGLLAGIALALAEWALEPDLVRHVSDAFFVIVSIALAAAYWLMTSRERPDRLLSARRVARACLIGGILADLLAVLAVIRAGRILAPSWMAIELVGDVLTGAGVIALLVHAIAIARRVPDDRLARHARVVLWGLGCVLAMTAMDQAGRTLQILTPSVSADRAVAAMLRFSDYVIAPPALAFGVWGLILLLQYRRRLGAAAVARSLVRGRTVNSAQSDSRAGS